MTTFDICNHTFLAALHPTNGEVRCSTLPPEQRTVVLVWHLYGLIGNMGLVNLFEAEIDNDPAYAFSKGALHEIGAVNVAPVFDEAVSLCYFSSGRPRKWRTNANSVQRLEELDDRFLELGEELENSLARYISERPSLMAMARSWEDLKSKYH